MDASRLLTLVMGEGGVIPLHDKTNDMCAQRRLGSAWASAQSDQSLRCLHEESLGPWQAFEGTAKTDQNPGPMGAVLKNDVHSVLVVCKPRPIGAGDIAGVKCHVLASASSPRCRGTLTWGF